MLKVTSLFNFLILLFFKLILYIYLFIYLFKNFLHLNESLWNKKPKQNKKLVISCECKAQELLCLGLIVLLGQH